MEQYQFYSVSELINDPAFQDWAFHENENSARFWNEVMNKYPEAVANINEAKQVLKGIAFHENFPGEEKTEQALAQVIEAINKERKIVLLQPAVKWLAAASVILICGFLFFLLKPGKTGKVATGQNNSNIQPLIKPGGDKAVLTLADGSQVVLDSAGNRTIASQGNTTIINLNGKLSYNAGEVNNQNNAVVYNTITTPKGGQYQLVLADGSKVWLNSASSLRFPTAFAGTNRVVELTGEGYFEVAHNAAKPFQVKVNDMEVEVLGTHFNINGYADEPLVKTTLLEGRVKVKKNGNFAYLNPGQQAIIQPAKNEIGLDNDVNIEEVMAWKNGKFLFNGADLETIMRQVSRWYDVDFVYEKKISETISGGLSRSESISRLLTILEATGKVQFKINGKQIVVITK